MAKITSNTKIVKVVPTRGWGDGFYEVVRHGENECLVRPVGGGVTEPIYTAHLYTDPTTVRKEKEWRQARANKVGKGN